MLPNAVAQAFGGRYPDVIALKVDSENVVMGWRALHRYLLDLASRIANQHLRLVRVERGTIDGPVSAVVISQPLVGGEPCAIGVYSFDLVEEVAGQAAVFLQEVGSVAAVVAAGVEAI